ncbi:MAG: cytochrome c [Pseudomonadales bacterium]|nr:cytochrome c [Pseudomonadales bacterium]NRA14685.1 cytochrome c [Oceanospirillaceae bacterium]
MRIKTILLTSALLIATLSSWSLFATSDLAAVNVTQGDVNRGAYLARASGCIACHTATDADGRALAGGAALDTPFGTFYAPNLTTDPEHGIGAWTLQQFTTALRQGTSPDGQPYYPAFPYSFYSKLTDQDVADLWAAFQTVPAVAQSSPEHNLSFPFNLRFGLNLWQSLFFDQAEFTATESADPQYARGEYLVESVTHCAACHTPRNLFGALQQQQQFAGSESLLQGEGKIPAITADQLKQAGWSHSDLSYALQSGIKPDGDVFGGSMAEVVKDGTAYMQKQDLQAIAYYLLNRK